jgi:hypothetical protein
MDQGLDSFSAKVGRWRMEEVLVDISEHARRGLKVMVGSLERGLLATVLGSSMAGEDSRYVKDDGGFFKSKRILRGGFMGEGIEPNRDKVSTI